VLLGVARHNANVDGLDRAVDGHDKDDRDDDEAAHDNGVGVAEKNLHESEHNARREKVMLPTQILEQQPHGGYREEE